MPLDKEQLARAEVAKAEHESTDLHQSLTAAGAGPDAATALNVIDLSKRTGIPADTVSRNVAEITERMEARRYSPADAATMWTETPRTAQYLQNPRRAAVAQDNYETMQSLERHNTPEIPFWSNVGRSVAGTGATLVGDLIEFGGRVSSDFEETMRDMGVPNPGIVFGDDGISFSWDVNTDEVGNIVTAAGEAISEEDFGYVPNFSWENLKGDLTAKNLAGYIVETGAPSLVHAAATLATLPGYIMSRSEAIAEERVRLGGEGEEVDTGDLAAALPTAVTVALIERYSAKGFLGKLEGQAGTGLKHAGTEVLRAIGREAGTEFLQEQVEYVGERFGTGANMDLLESIDRGLAGAVAGGGVGGGMRSVSVTYEALANRVEDSVSLEVNSHMAQSQIDAQIESIQSNTLLQSSPEDMAEYLREVGVNEQIFFSPEGVQAAVDAGLAVPAHMIEQLGTEQDISVTLESFGMDIVADEALLAGLRPHMKSAPELMSQDEIQARDGTEIKEMIERAHDTQEIHTESKAIHDEVAAALVATGRLSPANAKYSAAIIPAYVTTKVAELRARGVEITVAEAYEAMGLKIERKGRKPIEGEVLQQAADSGYEGTDAAEASEWVAGVEKFGAEGMTTEARLARAEEMGFDTEKTWYHGTNRVFSGFDLDAEPKFDNPQQMLGTFFTKNAKYAARYTEGNDPQLTDFEGGSVIPVHPHGDLRLKPEDTDLIDEIESGDWEFSDAVEYVEKLKAEGYDGISFDKDREIAVFDSSQVRSPHAVFDPDAAESANILAQEGDAQQPRGEMEYFDDARIIRLTNTSDLSTFLHETGHLFLEAEKQFAAKYGISDNQEAILKLLGVDSFEQITTPQHEIFARTFEDYLRTGKAPSIQLRDAFSAFARWLSHVYANIRQLGLKLEPEVTVMFDRMLASEIEAEELLSAAPYNQLFKNKEQAGMTDAEWDAYQARVVKRDSRTKMTLTERVLQEYRNRRSKEWNEEKRPVIESEKVRLSGEPVYLMLASLKKVKLDSDSVKEIMGGKIPAGKVLGNVAKEGGQDPDHVADKYGFATTKEMIAAISDTPTLLQKAKSNAEAKMVAKYGDILNDGTMEQEVREAAHNVAEEELLLSELRALNKKQRKPAPNRKEYQYQAKTLMSQLRLSEIKPNKYYRAEVRAAQKADSSNNPAEQLELKKLQLANHYLYKEALRARKETAKQVKYIKDAWRRKYSPAKVHRSYINMMKQYAGMYNAKNTPEARQAAATTFYNWLIGQQTGGVQLTLKDLNIIKTLDKNHQLSAPFKLKNFDELSTEEIRGVAEMVKHLRYVGGIEGGTATEEHKKQQAEAAATARETGTQRARQDEANRLSTLSNSISHILNTLPSLRNLIRNLDGWDENGWFYNNVYLPIVAAEDVKLATSKKFYDDFEEIMGDMSVLGLESAEIGVVGAAGRKLVKKLGLSESMGSRESVPRKSSPNEPLVLSSTGRFMLAVYWGTESSREAIRKGHGVTDGEVHKMMSYLTPTQLEAVNNLWKFNETMAKPLFAAGVRRDGIAPEKIPHAPFTVQAASQIVDGTVVASRPVEMTGGHMTLHYTLTEPEIRIDASSLAPGHVTGLTPSKATALHARTTSGGKTVDLTTHNITKSIDENSHEIGYADVGRDMQRLLGKDDVVKSIIETRGAGFHKALMQNIQGVTTNRVEAEMYSAISHAVTTLKSSKSAMYLMYNVKNVMQQFPSAFAVVAEIGPMNYAKSALEFYGTGWEQNKAFVFSKSPQMADRIATMTRESSEMMKRAVRNTKMEKFAGKAAQYGFTPHVIIDLGISMPLWMQKYNTGLMEHGSEERAIADANTAVNETVGTGLDIGMGKALHSNQSAFIKLLTLFGSWFNSTIFQRAYRNTEGFSEFATAKAVEAMFITPLLIMMASEAIVMNIPDLWDEDEEGPDYDGAAVWMASNMARFLSGTIPMMGTAVSAIHGYSQSNLLQDLFELPADTIDAIKKTAKGDMGAAEGLEALIKIVGTVKPLYGSGNVVRGLDFTQSYVEGEEGDTITPSKIYQAVAEGRDRNTE